MTRTTEKGSRRKAAKPPHDPEIEASRLGSDDFAEALGGMIRFEPKGGKCSHARCTADAPFVMLGKRRTKLPCPEHAEEEKAALVEEERVARAAACMADSGVTERLRAWSLDSYAEACGDESGLAALAVAQRWVKTYLDTGAATNLLLWGPVGCGKTGLAWGVVRALCEQGRPAKIANFRKLLAAMKDCYSRKQPTTWALDCGIVPVLVLDDIGSERPTEWARDELLGIVDERYERGLPTIYVSNFTPADLARRLGRDDDVIGRRIVSRMREGATTFEFTGGDRRIAA